MPKRKATYVGSLSERYRRLLLRTAREAVAAGQALVSRGFSHTGAKLRRKGEGDFVTQVDLTTERCLKRHLLDVFPEHGFLGEELRPCRPDAEFCWVVDPIDGTSNFGRGLDLHAVSVACLHNGAPVAAAVHCQPEDAVYSAAAGLGAYRQRQRLNIPQRPLGEASIIGVQWLRGARRLEFLPGLVNTGTRVRNLGSTVVHLCHVAAGRFDANIQEQGFLWDYAAAGLVVLEAGGRLTDWRGEDLFPVGDLTRVGSRANLAAGPTTHRQLVGILALA